MFGLLNEIEETVSNTIDVGIGVLTFGEYGELNKKTISKLIADGITIATIAESFDVAEEIIEQILED